MRFQKRVGTSISKYTFDFGSRGSSTVSGRVLFFIKKQFQYLWRVHLLNIPLAPVLFLGDLCIQQRTQRSNVLALFLSNFFYDVPIPDVLGVIKDIKLNAVPFALNLSQNAIFEL